MEKQGEILNQLAVISDLLDRMNLVAQSKMLILEISNEEFERMRTLICDKSGQKITDNESFSMMIGEVKIIFNKSNA